MEAAALMDPPDDKARPVPSDMLLAADLPPGTTVFDPGLEHIAFARSAITRVDAEQGRLAYRGRDAVELSRTSSFAEVARLLVIPPGDETEPDAASWNDIAARASLDVALLPHPSVPTDLRAPINYVAAGLALVAAQRAAGTDPLAEAAGLIANVRSLASTTVHGDRPASSPTAEDPFSIGSLVPRADASADQLRRALESVLILYADHEMAASTTALRVAASAGAGLFASAAAAAATFGGKRHGGASEAVGALFDRLADAEAVEAELERVHKRETRLPGFGHRIHHGHDPRVTAIVSLIESLPSTTDGKPGFDAATYLERRAGEDAFMRERKLFPNPDYYAVQLLMALGFPSQASSAVLAVGRSAGWAAHWLEATADQDSRLLRPRQVYVGP